MMNKLKSLFGFGNPSVYGPAVSGKREGENTTCYIPFSKGGENPVIATEEFAMPRKGGDLNGAFNLNGVSAKNKLWLTKVNQLRPDTPGPKTLAADSQYILLGGQEYGRGCYRGIGIGFTSMPDRAAPVFFGSQEIDSNESTNADFIVATRATVKPDLPVVRFRVTAQGQIVAADGYKPEGAQSMVTKQFMVDAIAELQKQIDELKKA